MLTQSHPQAIKVIHDENDERMQAMTQQNDRIVKGLETAHQEAKENHLQELMLLKNKLRKVQQDFDALHGAIRASNAADRKEVEKNREEKPKLVQIHTRAHVWQTNPVSPRLVPMLALNPMLTNRRQMLRSGKPPQPAGAR